MRHRPSVNSPPRIHGDMETEDSPRASHHLFAVLSNPIMLLVTFSSWLAVSSGLPGREGCTYSLPYHALELAFFSFFCFCAFGTSVYSAKPGGGHAHRDLAFP